jgi:pimeloyl-ACP methyl ester carboxylesterase
MEKHKKYDFNYPHRELNIPYDAETNINIVQFKTADSPSHGVVLYFHGNKKNIGWYARHTPDFTGKNYEVWMPDYPGFGKSTGKFTESRLYDYALQLYKLARTRYQPSNIIIYGKSMGTGIAAELAAVRDCRYLILETPYYSMSSLAKHYFPIYPVDRMMHYHFPTNEYLPKVTAPVILFHGTDDGIIPYSNAQKLRPLLKSGDEFITIPGGSHNDLDQFPLFHQKLDSLLN